MAVRLRRRLKALRARCDRSIARRILGFVSTTFTVPYLTANRTYEATQQNQPTRFGAGVFSNVVGGREVKEFVTKTLAPAVSVPCRVRAPICGRGR